MYYRAPTLCIARTVINHKGHAVPLAQALRFLSQLPNWTLLEVTRQWRTTHHRPGWTESLLYSFQNGNDGADVAAGLVFDNSGNLYGAARAGGSGGGGTVFELTLSGGHWTLSVIYSFTGSGGPASSLVIDTSGNLYGTTVADGAYGAGNIFKLTFSGGGWTYTDLYDFTGGSDGGNPFGGVTPTATSTVRRRRAERMAMVLSLSLRRN